MLKNSLNGVFSVLKSKGLTSRDVVDNVQLVLSRELLGKSREEKIKKKERIKIGHGGTLDPLAEGVLVIGVGSGCKELTNYLTGSKEYIVTAKLGQSTDTFDSEGEVTREGNIEHLTRELIEKTLSSFKGNGTQVPPVYSAIKMNGKRLYDYARKNKVLPNEIKPRPVFIKEIELLDFKKDTCLFRVECGGGTYMRSLVNDMAISMGTFAYMTELKRTKHGLFRIQDSVDINQDLSLHPQDLYYCALQSKAWSYCALKLLWQRPNISKVETWMKIASTLSKKNPFINYGTAIQRINLSTISDYVNDDSLAVLSVCENLDRLVLAGCDSITDNGFSYFCKHAGRYLTCIDLSEMTLISDTSLISIANTCNFLQALTISLSKESHLDTISDTSIIKIAQKCKKLKRIRFTNRKLITDDSILTLSYYCPSIVELDITQCMVTNESVNSVLSNLKDLQDLKLKSCIYINDYGFLHSSITSLHQLRLLDLSGVAQISDLTINWIINAAPKLRSLVLSKCENITDKSVQYISRLGKNLHYIHFGSCKNITDFGVLTLVSQCPRIRYVDLSSCLLITDQSVVALATLTKLKRIGLVRCELITDRSIVALSNAYSTLERVHLSHCRNLTVKALSRFVIRCKHLNHLSLSFIAAFQSSEFQRFSREPPKDYITNGRFFCVISGFGIHKLRARIRTIKYADMILNTNNLGTNNTQQDPITATILRLAGEYQ